MPWSKSDVIPIRWSLILSRTGSMSSWVRFLDPTRPFSIPNIPPKPPFLALQRNEQIQDSNQDSFSSSSKFRWRNSTLKEQNRDFKMLPFLVSVWNHNSLLLHFFILIILIWGLIIDTSQVTFHWIHLDQLRGTQTISSAIHLKVLNNPINETFGSL